METAYFPLCVYMCVCVCVCVETHHPSPSVCEENKNIPMKSTAQYSDILLEIILKVPRIASSKRLSTQCMNLGWTNILIGHFTVFSIYILLF
jgi:hypothetical protein